MPELPEVETIKRDLTKKIVGKRIIEIKVFRDKVIKEPKPKELVSQLKNEKVLEVIRRAKLLILKLSQEKFLIIHLRISGWLLYGKVDEKARVALIFNDNTCLNYMDSRLLGELRLRKSWQDLKFVQSLGKEPFDINEQEFVSMVREKTAKIKPLLLDQTFVAGIGNIYAQEALFLAKINPNRKANSLSQKEAKLLHKATVDVLKQGIKNRGSSVDDYFDTEGKSGGMEKLLKVYSRKDQPCFNCKTPIKKISLGGRGTCFCPQCQK